MWITFLILCTTMRLYTEKEQLSTFFLRVCAQLPSFGRGQGKKPAPPVASGGRGETCGAGQKNGHSGRAGRRGKADTQAGRGEAKNGHTGRAKRRGKADTQTQRSERKKQTHRHSGAKGRSGHTGKTRQSKKSTPTGRAARAKKRTHKQDGAEGKSGHTGRAERKKRRRRGEAQKGLKNDLCKNRKIGYQSALFRE